MHFNTAQRLLRHFSLSFISVLMASIPTLAGAAIIPPAPTEAALLVFVKKDRQDLQAPPEFRWLTLKDTRKEGFNFLDFFSIANQGPATTPLSGPVNDPSGGFNPEPDAKPELIYRGKIKEANQILQAIRKNSNAQKSWFKEMTVRKGKNNQENLNLKVKMTVGELGVKFRPYSKKNKNRVLERFGFRAP